MNVSSSSRSIKNSSFAQENTTTALLYGISALSFLFIGFLFALIYRWKFTHFSGMNPAIRNEFSQLGLYHGIIMIYLGMVPLGLGFFGSFETRHIRLLRLIAHFSLCCVMLGGIIFCIVLASSLIDIELVFHGFAQRQLALFALLVVLLGLMLLSCVLIADVSKMMLDYFGSKHFHPFVFCCQFASAVLFLGLFLQIAPHIIAALISQTTHEGFVEFNWASLFEFLNGSMGYILLLPAMGVLSVIISDHTKKDFRFARLFTISISLLVVVGYFKFSIDYLEASFQLLNTIEQVALGLPPIVLMMAIIRNLRYPLKKKTTALYFAMMSIPMFSLGAISGIALLIPTFAHVAQDSSYAAAHLHYLLAPGALFTLIGGAYHYYPKIRGRALDDVLGKLHFWLSIIAINSVFLPMLVQGLFPLTDLSYLMFCASVALFMSQFLFIANIFKTEFSRQP